MNVFDSYTDAVQYVTDLKRAHGIGVSTLCVLYNGTGEGILFNRDHSWHGHIGMAPYPTVIGNGKWAGFLHVKSTEATDGSTAAVIYRGKNKEGEDTDFLLAWDTPWIPGYTNKAYADINQAGHYDRIGWGIIERNLSHAGTQNTAKQNGCVATVEIGLDSTPLWVAKLSLE